jgi:6-phosphogluconolactonase (cycloisomerase 2 family)
MLGTGAACAQSASMANDAAIPASASSSPVAYVYVSNSITGSSRNDVYAFSAAANGRLTPISGSPFQDNIDSMAVNGKYLFGSRQDGKSVAALSIQSNGALKWATSTNVAQFNGSGCGGNSPVILDHTGASLYVMANSDSLCDEEFFQSFQVEKPTGYLNFLGATPPIFVNFGQLTFSANNRYAYQATCSDYRGFYSGTITGYQRHSNGLLTLANLSAPVPDAQTGDFFCADHAAADPANHVAIEYQLINSSTELPDGLPQIAAYTADTSGNLSTTSTRATMPFVLLQYPLDMKMSPSGRLLAVAGYGNGGLQIFHFHGAGLITYDTGLLTTDQIDQIFWDNSNHLYAIGYPIDNSPGRLHVYTATPTTVFEDLGSPYIIKNPQSLIVQPTTPRP